MHTQTPWDFTIFSKPDGSQVTTKQDVAETVAHSALQREGTELWGVTDSKLDDDGAVRVICYTGNGTTSAENAAFIARACNAHSDMLAALMVAENFIAIEVSVAKRSFGPDPEPGEADEIKCAEEALAVVRAAISKAEKKAA